MCGAFPTRIGAFCSIAHNVTSWTADSHQTKYVATSPLQSILGMPMAYPEHIQKSQGINIGNDVWIGEGVRLMAGVSLADGCIIAARSVVTKDCQPYTIYGGSPAKFIRLRFTIENIAQLLQIRWWEWPVAKIRANIQFFNTDLNSFKGNLQSLIINV